MPRLRQIFRFASLSGRSSLDKIVQRFLLRSRERSRWYFPRKKYETNPRPKCQTPFSNSTSRRGNPWKLISSFFPATNSINSIPVPRNPVTVFFHFVHCEFIFFLLYSTQGTRDEVGRSWRRTVRGAAYPDFAFNRYFQSAENREAV